MPPFGLQSASMTARQANDDMGVMSFGDHLEELRRRVLLALIVPLPLAMVIFIFAEPVRIALCKPLFDALRANALPVQLQALSPIETIVLDMKLALIGALVLSAPWILWQIWQFVRPGLYNHERRFVYLLLPGSAVLTVVGIALLYFAILPLVLAMLISFSTGGEDIVIGERVASGTTENTDVRPATVPLRWAHPASPEVGETWIKMPEQVLCVAVPSRDTEPDTVVLGGSTTVPEMHILSVPLTRATLIAQQYRLSEYINFVLVMTAGTAIAFQLPLVILLLGWLDIVRLETLRKHRRYAFFGCAIVAAVVTPPDIMSMLLMWGPLYGLYELGMLLLRYLPAWRVAGLRPPVTAAAGVEPTASSHQPRSHAPTASPSSWDAPPPTPIRSERSVPRGSLRQPDEGDIKGEPEDGAGDGAHPQPPGETGASHDGGPMREPPDAGDDGPGPAPPEARS